MLKIFNMSFLMVIMISSLVWGEQSKPDFTQKSFVKLLVQRLDWTKGLPPEPSDRDYLQILGGKRTFKYEAESAYNEKTDRVTVRNFNLYGPYTGKGWILGVSENTDTNLTIHVPVNGEYLLKAVIKGSGFIWYAGDRKFVAGSKSDSFQEVEVGRLALGAGKATMRVTIPPGGAFDSFTLSAPDTIPIQPLAGWRFKEPLTALQLAEIMFSITGGYEKLPGMNGKNHKLIPIVDSLYLPTNVQPTSSSEFGDFSSRMWLRSDFRGGSVKIPVQITETGYFELYANLMGGNISGDVNEYPFSVHSKPFLGEIRIGLFRMESGDNFITFNLPPMAGIDCIKIIPKDTKSDDILKLSGVKGPPGRLVTQEDADAVLKAVVESKTVKR